MKLLIPGPVTTHPDVRAAMAQDIAPWDNDIRPVYADVKRRVLAIAHGGAETHACIALQGAGHFGMEAAVRTFVGPGCKLLVPNVGAYADRLIRLAREAGRDVVDMPVPQEEPLSPATIAAALAADPSITHVGMIYSETGTGVIHDPAAVGAVVRAAGRRLILDCVSAFGALPLDVSAQPELDVAVFTTNKCLEGLPGICFAISPIARLEACRGNAQSWSFDYSDIYENHKRAPGSFRFTPPVQVLFAFRAALDLYDQAGGQPARLARYRANADTLYTGLSAIGLKPYIARHLQGPIVMNTHAPGDPAWNLQVFVDGLKGRGWLISNFYNTPLPSFRVGCIGAITPDDMRQFVSAVDSTLSEMQIRKRGPAQPAEAAG